jgi:hypothetical protein
MRLAVYASLICYLLLSTIGCKLTAVSHQSTAQQPVAADIPTPTGVPTNSAKASAVTVNATAKIDTNVCALLTSAEIQAVQGEAVREMKGNSIGDGPFAISQCLYQTLTFSKSISLQLTQKASTNLSAKSPREFWKEKFGQIKEQNKEGNRERAREKEHGKARGTEEEEENRPPQHITGIGEEAYWTGNRQMGALYVLKGDGFLRISVGGPEEVTVKIKKSKLLAGYALKRL